METEKRELWDRLNNESERAHRAFQTFLSLPRNDRTVIEAYRSHVGNPEAAKPSDTWTKWSRTFAWSERAAAYDAHLDRIRERGIEKATEEEAKRQTREAERTRYRYNELMTMAHVRAMECLEDESWVNSNLRAQDMIQIIRLYKDAVMAFEPTARPREEDTWTEEDEIEIDRIIREVEEGEYPEEEDL